MNTKCFETETGSLYEVDFHNKQIRRLAGKGNPTPRTGKDGVWKKFMEISGVTVGERALITWSEETGVDFLPVYKCTMTSDITKIYDKVLQ